ncbi:radical SAM protein [Candidatus Bathyarchaeota archaeon]|nr:radical SAM protein [Candidatus Bathyarchaeota archaeon]
MRRLLLPKPISAGIFLSYKCTSECKHCMYACSPRWRADWISEEDLERILIRLSDKILPSPLGQDRIGINYGLHFTGGEPFLNFDLLLKAVKIAHELRIPSTFVETNCFWCVDDRTTEVKLLQLKNEGLDGMLLSVNTFILEQVPFERMERAIKISSKIFGRNTIVYQNFFYDKFKRLNIKGNLSFQECLQKVDLNSLSFAELIPMGRACYKLEHILERLYGRYPAKKFFNETCREELTRDWHVHIDNYRNYITGYCGGISLGDWLKISDTNMEVSLDELPILDALVNQGMKRLYEIGKEFGYRERGEGYVHKCHLCIDIRRHIAKQTKEFKELNPREFYFHLDI